MLNQALLRALQIATAVHRACEDVGPGRGQPWLQQIAKAETGNEPSTQGRACYGVDRGLRTIARDAAARAMQRKRQDSIRTLNYANPTDVYSPFENTEAELQRR